MIQRLKPHFPVQLKFTNSENSRVQKFIQVIKKINKQTAKKKSERFENVFRIFHF